MSEKVRKCEEDGGLQSEHDVRVLEARASRSNGEDISNESRNRFSGDKASPMGHVYLVRAQASHCLGVMWREASPYLWATSPPLHLKDGYIGFWSVWTYWGYFHIQESLSSFSYILCIRKV